MNLVLYYFTIATVVPLAVSQDLKDFINDRYGSCASSCASQAYDWQKESTCTDSQLCWCFVDDAAFFEKMICCIAQSEDCSAEIDTINQDLKLWCSWETDIKTPHQTNFRDSPPFPSICPPPVWHTPSPESEFTRRSDPSAGHSNDSYSAGKVAGIIVAAVVVTLVLAIGLTSGCNRVKKQVGPKPPPLPMHTAMRNSSRGSPTDNIRGATPPHRPMHPVIRLTSLPPQNAPQRPPTAIVRGGSPEPPPPYSAKDEPTPQYEARHSAS